jgi:hypothetical protein
MDVRFTIDPKVRAELHFFTGVNFSGNRDVVRIFVGGRRQGPEIDGDRVKSVGMSGPIGTRLVLCRSDAEEGWESEPWRAIVLVQGSTFRFGPGVPAVQVPDLDQVDRFDAKRTDPDAMEALPIAASLSEGVGWTYGRLSFRDLLKGHVRRVRVDLVG